MKKRIGRFLAYINRARQYIGIINSSLLLVILLKSFDIVLAWYWYPVLIVCTVAVMLVFGFFDTILGFRKMEMLNVEHNHPIQMEIYKMVKEINKKLNKEI